MSEKRNSIQMVIDDLEASMVEVGDSAGRLWAVSVKNNKLGESSIKTAHIEELSYIMKGLFRDSNDSFWIDFMMDRYTGMCQ